MKNGLNLFIMSYDDVLNWYKPKTESESYILNLMRDYYEDTDGGGRTQLEDLRSELHDAKNKFEKCELELYDVHEENNQLRETNTQLIEENAQLRGEISVLDENIDSLIDELNIFK